MKGNIARTEGSIVIFIQMWPERIKLIIFCILFHE